MGKKQPSDLRRQKILEAALAEVLERGIEGTSVEGIARRAELTKGGIYHHFSSKDEILLAVNGYLFENVTPFADEARVAENPAEGIKTYIRKYTRYWHEHPRELAFFFLSMSKMLSNPLFQKGLEESMNGMQSLFCELFEKMEARDAPARALALLAALDGITAYLVTIPGLDPEKVANQFIQIFLNSGK